MPRTKTNIANVSKLSKMSDEDETFEDSGDVNYVSPINNEKPDIEDVCVGERIPIEIEVEFYSDEEEGLITEAESATLPLVADVCCSTDSTI
ncbi:hypothetical protein FQR65_LT08884 [Abscondita terminalis]|nr:hypothetical protein FQR65_LT08884 [Abscondita terminalis]